MISVRKLAHPNFWKRYWLLIAVLVMTVAAGCGSGSGPTPTPDTGNSDPVSFPYIFSGKFTVAGEPGPKGVPLFARLGSGRGSYNEAIREGEYTNLLISPSFSEDVGKPITFHLGLPDGSNVMADQTVVFHAVGEAQFLTLDLTFPSMP
jgi:hypothetical protein